MLPTAIRCRQPETRPDQLPVRFVQADHSHAKRMQGGAQQCFELGHDYRFSVDRSRCFDYGQAIRLAAMFCHCPKNGWCAFLCRSSV